MYTAKIQNKSGEILTLTGNEPNYQVTNIIGLDPPTAQINKSSAVGLDGALFNSAKLEPRNIVITLKINGNIEANRRKLYKYFRTKDWCRFFYANSSVNVYIDGYVESFTCNLFSRGETAQISIICLYPYFRDIVENSVSATSSIALFSFPFFINIGEPIPLSEYDTGGNVEVYNEAESETGMTIEITVNTPVSSILIRDLNSADAFTLVYPFRANDKVIINTTRGSKSIMLLRGNTTINIFSALQPGSTFFQLASGINIFSYYADGALNSSRISLIFKYNNIFRGV